LTTLQHIAPLLARVGVPVDAAILAGAVTAATERPLFGEAEVGIAALEQQLIDELGEDRFTELRDRGATMSRREVISLALRRLGPGRTPSSPDRRSPPARSRGATPRRRRSS